MEEISSSRGVVVMGEISSSRERSHGMSQKSECKLFKIFTLLLWTLLSIAMVILGSIHVDNCPAEPMIPIYLIVAGAFHLLGFVLIPLKIVIKLLLYSIESILGLFSFCWFIAGSVWVFRIYQDNPRHCNNLVYNYAFGILIFEYIFIAFIVAVICIFTCCVGFLAASETQTSGRNTSPEDEEALK